jgi:hypothetical protein
MSSTDNVGYFACHIKQFILSSHDTASLILYSDGMFHVISGASFCLDESEKPVVTGTLGDKISNIVLIQVNRADVLGSIYILFHDAESTTGLLGNLLLATTHLVTDTITSSANNEYSFFGNTNLINAPDLASNYASRHSSSCYSFALWSWDQWNQYLQQPKHDETCGATYQY